MEPVNLAQKRSSNIMDQKGSGNTSTISTHLSPDLVEHHYMPLPMAVHQLKSLVGVHWLPSLLFLTLQRNIISTTTTLTYLGLSSVDE